MLAYQLMHIKLNFSVDFTIFMKSWCLFTFITSVFARFAVNCNIIKQFKKKTQLTLFFVTTNTHTMNKKYIKTHQSCKFTSNCGFDDILARAYRVFWIFVKATLCKQVCNVQWWQGSQKLRYKQTILLSETITQSH